MSTIAQFNESCETLYALKESASPAAELITNNDSTQFYLARSFSGRLCTYYQTALYWGATILFLNTSSMTPAERARHTALKIKANVAVCLQEMRAQDEALEMWRASGDDDNTASPMRREIMRIGDACCELFNLTDPMFFSTRLFYIQRVFQRVLNVPLFSDDDLKVLDRFQGNYATVVLEGLTQSAVPFEPLRAIEGPLASPREEDLVKEWIDEVLEVAYKMTPHLVQQALRRVCEEDNTRLGVLESRLFRRKLQFIQNEDPLYTEWLDKLHPGSVVSAGTFELQLGRCLNDELPVIENLGFDAYALPGQPEAMLLLGKGVATIRLWKAFFQANQTLVPQIKVLQEDPQGRFMVVEKISHALDKMPWHFNGQDAVHMQSILDLLKRVIEKGVTPPTFRADCLFMTVTGQIVTMMPVTPGIRNDFHILLDFAKTVSKQYLPFFAHIMKYSRLKEAAVPSFYLHVAEDYLLETLDLSLAQQAALCRNSDPMILEKTQNMIRDLKACRLSLLREKLPAGATEEEKTALERRINRALINFQKECGAPFPEVKEFQEARATLERLL